MYSSKVVILLSVYVVMSLENSNLKRQLFVSVTLTCSRTLNHEDKYSTEFLFVEFKRGIKLCPFCSTLSCLKSYHYYFYVVYFLSAGGINALNLYKREFNLNTTISNIIKFYWFQFSQILNGDINKIWNFKQYK